MALMAQSVDTHTHTHTGLTICGAKRDQSIECKQTVVGIVEPFGLEPLEFDVTTVCMQIPSKTLWCGAVILYRRMAGFYV